MENGEAAASIVVWLQRVPDGFRTSVTVDTDSLISELGMRLVGSGAASNASIRYVHKGRVLQPAQRLNTYDVKPGDTVYYSISNSPTHADSVNRPSSRSNLPEEMMVSPLMDTVVRNPDLMMMIMDSNPTIRALRQRSPELNAILSDPQTLQDAFTAMRSPAMMRELMRTSDRALSNIDAVPGGFDALRQVYTEVQEPVWETVASAAEERPRRDSAAQSSYDLDQSPDEPFPQAWPGEQPPAEEESAAFLRPVNPFSVPLGGTAPKGLGSPMWPLFMPTTAAAAPVPPSVRYRNQLETLRAMGFEDSDECERALVRHDGNLNRAIDELLNQQP